MQRHSDQILAALQSTNGTGQAIARTRQHLWGAGGVIGPGNGSPMATNVVVDGVLVIRFSIP